MATRCPPPKENPMRHAWKIATVFILIGLSALWLRSSMVIPDSLAVPAALVGAVGFSSFVLIGALTRKQR